MREKPGTTISKFLVKKLEKPRHMTSQKTARIEMRVIPEKKQQWEREARAQGVSLSAWLEHAADRVLAHRERYELGKRMYPNRPDLWGREEL